MIEFSLTFNSGPERESQEDAENDANLSQFAAPGMPLRKVQNRNVYWADKDRARIKARQVLGTNGVWGDRPSWPDACWNQISSLELSED